jgi:hypothetical protein
MLSDDIKVDDSRWTPRKSLVIHPRKMYHRMSSTIHRLVPTLAWRMQSQEVSRLH